MAWISLGAAAIGALGTAYSANSAESGQRKANQMNLQIAREQMGFQERMSGSSYQRAVGDLKAAGLNPMIAALRGGASTPSGASAHMESEKSQSSAILAEGIPKAISSAMGVASVQNTKAQTVKTIAETRKTAAEAQAIEDTLPYTAQNAAISADMLSRQYAKLGHEVHLLMREETLKDMDIDQLKPLVIKYQELQNRATELGIPVKEAEAEFFKTVPEAKWLAIIRSIFK